ncbi:hypothetical protein GCM10019016_108300 [Streptomyces prasinosporus]|uniref:Uncharacterized protein n=1 Tax=Streptomyces prasinosporus TaxID=68256 RepID=A0ABP6UB06_9ACTN
MDAGAGGPGPADDVGVPLGGLRRGEQLDERGGVPVPVRRGLPHGLRPLGEEQPFLPPEVPPGQPSRGGDAG